MLRPVTASFTARGGLCSTRRPLTAVCLFLAVSGAAAGCTSGPPYATTSTPPTAASSPATGTSSGPSTESATSSEFPTPVSGDNGGDGGGRPALTVLTAPAQYQIPVKASETISDGAIIVTNPLDRPVTLESVEPMFLPGTRTDTTAVTGTHLVELSATDPADMGLGIQRAWPPKLLPGERLLDVKGLQVPAAASPQRRYVLVVGFRVRDGMAVVTGLRVRFRADDHEYAQTITHDIRLCEGRPADATTCPPPPHL